MGLFSFKKKKEIIKSGYEGIPRKYKKSVDEINSYKEYLEKLSDEEFYKEVKDIKFKEKGREEIFAYIREASGRVLGMRHFDVQLMGGLVLTDGEVAEMKTGEGKTLTSTLSIIYKALKGEKVYVITTNEYLSERDAKELEPLYKVFGLSVGVNKADMSTILKQEVYKQDIIYTVNSELVFDYLRDNMVNFKTDRVNPNEYNYALIDEVDSILIDEARTPLIISGADDINKGDYIRVNMFVKGLKEGDYVQDRETLYAELSDSGVDKAEEYFKVDNLFDVKNMPLLSVIRMSLKAHHSIERGVDYDVQEGKVVLINQSTGRALPNTKYSDGIHQAIEVKEGVEITPVTKTIANITYQDFFRQFKMLSGMTGTGLTEAEEFLEIYNMRVIPVPTNKPKLRVDNIDEIYLTLEDKLDAITGYVKKVHEEGRPVLIGTASVESSEWISERFKKEGIRHEVLNAKNHEREAEIISKAGEKGSVTVSTNMAGRGTDIKLGEGVSELGGLVVIGTERHESRRIDNQLRGRSGRQGDPGETHFVISLEDRILSRYLPENIVRLLGNMRQFKGESIKSGMVSRSLESAQKRVEGNDYDSRKNVLKFGSVLNRHRKVVYADREDVLVNNKVNELLEPMLEYYFESLLKLDEDRDRYVLDERELSSLKLVSEGKLDLGELVKYKEEGNLTEYVRIKLKELEGLLGEARYESLMRLIVLKHLDEGWTNHLSAMSELLTSVQLRSHAQKDPYREYLNDGEELFSEMIDTVSYLVSKEILSVDVIDTEEDVALDEETLDEDLNKEDEDANKERLGYGVPIEEGLEKSTSAEELK